MRVNPKQLAGETAVHYVEDGMVVGLGTGSTAYFAIVKLGQRVQNGMRVVGIPTSEQSRWLAHEAHIPLVDFDEVDHIDVTIDGADEIDPAFNLIKGGGGALLREKIVASLSRTQIIVADESKCVSRLGAFPLPVEIVPFGWQATKRRLIELGAKPVLRLAKSAPFVTDNSHYILDCDFGPIDDPPALEANINAICGVVECGLFTHLAHRIIIGKSDGSVEERTQRSEAS